MASAAGLLARVAVGADSGRSHEALPYSGVPGGGPGGGLTNCSGPGGPFGGVRGGGGGLFGGAFPGLLLVGFGLRLLAGRSSMFGGVCFRRASRARSAPGGGGLAARCGGGPFGGGFGLYATGWFGRAPGMVGTGGSTGGGFGTPSNGVLLPGVTGTGNFAGFGGCTTGVYPGGFLNGAGGGGGRRAGVTSLCAVGAGACCGAN